MGSREEREANLYQELKRHVQRNHHARGGGGGELTGMEGRGQIPGKAEAWEPRTARNKGGTSDCWEATNPLGHPTTLNNQPPWGEERGGNVGKFLIQVGGTSTCLNAVVYRVQRNYAHSPRAYFHYTH